MSTGTQQEEGERKGANQPKAPLLIPQTFDNKSLRRHCH